MDASNDDDEAFMARFRGTNFVNIDQALRASELRQWTTIHRDTDSTKSHKSAEPIKTKSQRGRRPKTNPLPNAAKLPENVKALLLKKGILEALDLSPDTIVVGDEMGEGEPANAPSKPIPRRISATTAGSKSWGLSKLAKEESRLSKRERRQKGKETRDKLKTLIAEMDESIDAGNANVDDLDTRDGLRELMNEMDAALTIQDVQEDMDEAMGLGRGRNEVVEDMDRSLGRGGQEHE